MPAVWSISMPLPELFAQTAAPVFRQGLELQESLPQGTLLFR